jgi:hypothetical protein
MVVAAYYSDRVSLPVSPFIVLGVILVASLAVFLWTTRKH